MPSTHVCDPPSLNQKLPVSYNNLSSTSPRLKNVFPNDKEMKTIKIYITQIVGNEKLLKT